MSTFIAATILAAAVATSPASREVDVAAVYEDVRVIRRVASVAGKDMPSPVLLQLLDENVERLRGRVDERNYAFATWTRAEAARVSDTMTVKKEDDGQATIVMLEAPAAYRLEITAPTRRYLAARNRPIQLDSVIVEYTNAAGERKTESFPIAQSLNPGESTRLELVEIGWNVTARLKATAEEGAMGHGTVELALLRPTLLDEPGSPFAQPTANLLAMKDAVRNRDVLEIRRLCDATTAAFDEMGSGVRGRLRPVGSVSPAGQKTSQRTLDELRAIEDLLTGTETQRREGMDRLHQLIISLRP